MRFKFPLVFAMVSITAHTLADTSIRDTHIDTIPIILNQQQLHEAQITVEQQGKQAINKIPQTSKELANVKLNQLDLSSTKTQLNQAQNQFKNTKALSTKLSDGQKYYLYSESIVSDSKQALAEYANHSPLDINQTISDYNALTKNAKTQIADNRLLIFISSSMPKRSIINLMSQASPLGAVFVIRGLRNNSYVKTYQYFYKLKGTNTVGIMINPTLFSAFGVSVVPTFALYQSSQNLLQTACNVSPVYTKIAGEVSVHYALEQLKQSHIANLSQIASNELDVLDNSNFYKGNSSANNQ